MQIECDVTQLLTELNNEYEHEQRLKKKQAEIKNEYQLYKFFCKYYELERNKLSSLNQFMEYCETHNIQLL